MAGNTFGTVFRVTTAGVSHGPGYLVIVDCCPPGLPLGVEDLLPDLRRRMPGQSALVTQRKEDDAPEIWSGVFEGKTDGTSIGILFRNRDQRSGDYGDIKDKYRIIGGVTRIEEGYKRFLTQRGGTFAGFSIPFGRYVLEGAAGNDEKAEDGTGGAYGSLALKVTN